MVKNNYNHKIHVLRTDLVVSYVNFQEYDSDALSIGGVDGE